MALLRAVQRTSVLSKRLVRSISDYHPQTPSWGADIDAKAEQMAKEHDIKEIKDKLYEQKHGLPKPKRFTHDDSPALLQEYETAGVIWLNRPQQLNAITLPMIHEMMSAIQEWNDDLSNVGLVLVRGVPPKGRGPFSFCCGGDVLALTEAGKNDLPLKKDFMAYEYRLNNYIANLKIPYVALIDGICMGGGVGVSVHGSFRVATERTVFAMPECGIGLFPDVGGGYFLPRMKGYLGTYLGLTGYKLKARDALYAGIATHFVESDRINALQKELIQLEDPDMDTVEEVISAYQSLNPTKLNKDDFTLAPLQEKIDNIFSASTVEEIIERLEEDGSDWAKKTIKTLGLYSPTSLKITLRQLREGVFMNLEEVFRMEYRISQRCLDKRSPDFHEGVRALLIDKDQKPCWMPSTLEDVSDELVDIYFQRLSPDHELQMKLKPSTGFTDNMHKNLDAGFMKNISEKMESGELKERVKATMDWENFYKQQEPNQKY